MTWSVEGHTFVGFDTPRFSNIAPISFHDRGTSLYYTISSGREQGQATVDLFRRPQERGPSMAKHAVPPMDAVPLAALYQRRIGKVTFVVSSFGNPKATVTAQQLLLRLLEETVTQESGLSVRECA